MKNIFVIFVILIAGCSTTQKEGMLIRAASYVPPPTKTQLSGKSSAQVTGIIQEGAQKFSSEELYSLNLLKLKILKGSVTGCHALFDTSNPDEKEIAFKSLSNEDYDLFARLYAKALTLGVNSEIKAFKKPSQREFENALQYAVRETDNKSEKLKPVKIQSEAEIKCTVLKDAMRYADQKRNSMADIVVKFMTGF